MPSPLTQILAPALFPFPTLPSTPPTGPVSGLDLAGAGSVLEAVLAPLWVWLVFAEDPGMLALIGGAVVIAAVAWAATAERR